LAQREEDGKKIFVLCFFKIRKNKTEKIKRQTKVKYWVLHHEANNHGKTEAKTKLDIASP